MSTVTVKTASKEYPVHIGRGILRELGALVRAEAPAERACIITDETVNALYGDAAAASLEQAGYGVCRFAFAGGEDNKNLKTVSAALEFLAEERFTRGDIIVALGGGIPGDVAGFTAASYLRGVRFVQVPTTLLAAVDSSVGGKTGVNLKKGKNLAGAFWQPEAVICDIACFDTLPGDVFADGAAEAIKTGVLGDATLFRNLCGKGWDVEDAVARCVTVKAAIVGEDEREKGSRQLLNLGHTAAHAIEKVSGYAVSHGHAVAIGMAMAARAAVSMELCTAEVRDSIEAALLENRLPTRYSGSVNDLLNAALSDKKREGGTITLVLPEDIGRCRREKIPVAALEDFLQRGMA